MIIHGGLWALTHVPVSGTALELGELGVRVTSVDQGLTLALLLTLFTLVTPVTLLTLEG